LVVRVAQLERRALVVLVVVPQLVAPVAQEVTVALVYQELIPFLLSLRVAEAV
jgi:hypothetical protein